MVDPQDSLDILWSRLNESDNRRIFWQFAFDFVVDYTYPLHKDRFHSRDDYRNYVLAQYQRDMGDHQRTVRDWQK